MSSEPIRVLQIMPAMDAGGMETFVMNIYRTLDRERVQFDFLYHYDKPCFFDDEIREPAICMSCTPCLLPTRSGASCTGTTAASECSITLWPGRPGFLCGAATATTPRMNRIWWAALTGS